MGDGRYIREQYNRDISSFYSAVWWPDMLLLCEEYGIKYTGMLIEDYTEEIDGLFPAAEGIPSGFSISARCRWITAVKSVCMGTIICRSALPALTS